MKTINETNINNYLFALRQRNLVYNGDFRYFSNQVKKDDHISYGVPDGWQYNDSGSDGNIDFNTSKNCCVIKKSSNSSKMSFKQALHEFPRWKQFLYDQKVTAVVSGNIDLPGNVVITLSDGIDSNSTMKSEPGDFKIEVQLDINPNAESVYLLIESDTPSLTISIHKAYGNIGPIAIENLNCIVQGVIGERKQYISTETAPAEELSLCKAPVELGNNYTRLNSVINGRFGIGSNGRSMLLDMRGYFSRAWNNGSGADPDSNNRQEPGTGQIKGDHVSTIEDDCFLKHQHALDFTIGQAQSTTGGTGPNTNLVSPTNSNTEEALNGKETRPKNISELYTIKWA